MPHSGDRDRLIHIVEAIDSIVEFVATMDYDGYRQDRKTQLSVERLLEITGEAANHISPELKARYPQVPCIPLAMA
jgi:uncharacterized protein with HEPN domain